MGALLGLKRYELRSGRVLLPGVRPGMGDFFARVLQWLGGALPGAVVRLARRGAHAALHTLHALAALVVIVAEHLLERALHALRYNTSAPSASGEASPFLREVAEHKKKLLSQQGKSDQAQ